MEYNNIILILLKEFPELSKQYEDDKDYYEGLPHLFLPDIFKPYVKILVENNDKDKLRNVFSFIENMITSSDIKTQEVAVVSFLETILPEREFVEKIRVYFQEKTKESFYILEKNYGWIS